MRKLTALVLALTVILSLMVAVPGALAESYYVYTQNGKSLNLREEPSTGSRVILTIPYGDEFTVFEFLGNGWAYGHWGGQFGYVQSRFLVTYKPGPKPANNSSSQSNTSRQTTQQTTDQQQLDRELRSQRDVTPFTVEVRATRVTGWVNFRVGPGSNTARITSYPDGKELLVTGETTNWYRAKDPDTGTYGYIHKNFATKVVRLTFTGKKTDGKKKLGTLNVNGQFELVCQLPEGYDLQVVNVRGSKIVASILSNDMVRPQMYLTVAFDETYADVARMNDLTDADLAILEDSFLQMNQVEITYRETGYGTKLLVAREMGPDTDFVDILSIYQGYFIEFNMSPNEQNANKTLTEEQINTCIDFLTNLDFNPV